MYEAAVHKIRVCLTSLAYTEEDVHSTIHATKERVRAPS